MCNVEIMQKSYTKGFSSLNKQKINDENKFQT